MNIKGIVSNIIPLDLKSIDLRKTRNTPDRDPQQGGGDNSQAKQHKLSESELEEALKILRELPGVKANNLQFRVERANDRIVVYLEDPTGKVLRRMPDQELYALIKNHNPDKSRGHLLNKAL
jgi:uncharacterized FlaG/YvyC family protein